MFYFEGPKYKKYEINDLNDFFIVLQQAKEQFNNSNFDGVSNESYSIQLKHIHEMSSKLSKIKPETDEEAYYIADQKRFFDYQLEYLEKQSMDDNNIKMLKPNFYYRGHYDSNYKLLPSVFRKYSHKINEEVFYNEIKINCASDFDKMNPLEQLVKMQHYDCPTRLLDVTSNPLVALFFACKNFSCKTCDKSTKGEFFAFVAYDYDILNYDSSRAIMLSCLSKIDYKQKQNIYNKCISMCKTGKTFSASNNGKDVEKLYKEIHMVFPFFEKKINPVDLLNTYIVEPLKNNSRIIKQDGAFIVTGLSKDEAEIINKIERKVAFKFVINDRNKILKQLDEVGINEKTLFPEVDKVADYLKNKI